MTFSAVLLAGGQSRRMGSNKATVFFEREPLWQRQLRLLRDLDLQNIFVSAQNEQSWRPRDTELLLDEVPSRGPMSGICAALTRMKTSHLLVLAVDMPFVTAQDLLSLVSLTKVECGVVPVTKECAEPLAATYPKESCQEFMAALSSSDTSLQKVIRQLAEMGKLTLMQLSPAEIERYRSVNTPDDLLDT